MVALGCGGWARRAAISAGFWADDYIQHAMLTHAYPSPRPSWDLFHFIDGSTDDHQRIVQFGVDPWWTHPQFRLSLLRPLPSLLTALDRQLFGMNAVPQHLHSLLWWALLLGVVALLLSELLPPSAAACAILLFGVEETSTLPVLWLSNRSALMATTGMLAATYCHLRWRSREHWLWRSASVALFAFAMLCGEYALASAGYLMCLEFAAATVASAHARPVSHLRALSPFAVIVALFLFVSTALGYGSDHSALYTSPFSAPLSYASKLSTGLPVLIADLTLGISADHWHFGTPWPAQLRAVLQLDTATWERLPSWHVWQIGLGVCGALLTIGMWLWLRPRLSALHARRLRLLLWGAVLGLLPVLGSFITARLAMPSSLGPAALFGSVLSECVSSLARPIASQGRWVAIGLAACVLYVHGIHAWMETQRTTELYSHVSHARTAWPLSLDSDVVPTALQQVVMIAAADANDAPHFPFVRAAWQHPVGRGFRLLSGAPGAHELVRVDDHTLDVWVVDDFGLEGSVVGSLTRDRGDALHVGEQVSLADLHVEVLETLRGQPVHIRCRFLVPLDDASLVFIHSTPQGLRRLRLPALGQRLHLPAPVMPDLALLLQPMAARP
jgi:hypothetical protein